MPWGWNFQWLLNCDRSAYKKHSFTHDEAPSNVGLKQVYAAVHPEVDIVAVHGAYGHREKTWTASNEVNWLRDLLPHDLPNAAIYTWGYTSTQQVPLQNIAENLVMDLWESREAENAHEQPIIFIGHSQGGTIVKSALLYSNSALHGHKEAYHSIKESTWGVIFAGTLELGPRLNGLEAYIASSNSASQAISNDFVFQEAHFLVTQLRQYALISDQFRTIYATESPRLLQSYPDERFPPAPFARSVNNHTNNYTTIFINANHGDMMKFDSFADDGYLILKEQIQDMLRNLRNASYDR